MAKIIRRSNQKKKISRVFIGIDPGATGAIAAIDRFQKIRLLEDTPSDEFAMARLVARLACYTDRKGAIERAQSMPKQGVKSMFTYGTNYGMWRGILAAFEIPFLIPTPQMWQKNVLNKAADKKPAMSAAGRIFPEAELYGPKGGMKHGRADALLIADFCRKNFIQVLL